MAPVRLSLLCVILTCINGSPTKEVYDTIVVGLGASGAAAASRLAAAGRKVLALEAQDRIGGRVHTVPFGDSVVELGAEWFDGTTNSVTLDLALKNNITVLEQIIQDKIYRSDGSSDKEDLIRELNGVVDKAYKNENLPSEPMSLGEHITNTVRDYLKEKHPEVVNDTDFLNNYLHYVEAFFGTGEAYYNWNDVTTTSTYQKLGGSAANGWHRYGYKTLFEILLNKYNNGPGYPTLDMKLNSEVTNIQRPEDPKDNVIVTVADGTKYIGKNVVVTMSVGVLKKKYSTLFSPALPKEKEESIKAIAMGEMIKIILRFEEAWWPKNSINLFVWRDADKKSISEEDSWLLGITFAATPASNEKVITLFGYGEAAKKAESLPNEVVKEKAMGLLRRFMGAGKTIPEPVEFIKSSWYKNPFVGGVNSYDDIDTPKHPTVRADLSQPLVDSSGDPRVLFAGEATHSRHFRTVHGAVESGWREADRLLSV